MSGSEEKKKSLALYMIIYPILFIISCIDYIIGIFKNNRKDSVENERNSILSKMCNKTETTRTYRSALHNCMLKCDDKNANMYDELANVIDTFRFRRAMGTREVISVFDEKQSNGKVFKKYSMGGYKWLTYEQIYGRVNNLSNGLLRLGLKSNQNVVLFSETRSEWLISAFACFRINVPVVTLYATLGTDALQYGINETKAKFLITSADQLTKIEQILEKIPDITNIIVFVDNHNINSFNEFKKISWKICENLSVDSIVDVEDIGQKTPPINDFSKPTKDDLAVIMYTSGSTGNPKGVMMSHGNFIVAKNSLRKRMGEITKDDTYIAFLPLAHVFELLSELVYILHGVRIGYSSALTLTDSSTGIIHGQKGDLRELNPSILSAVPIILERLNKAVKEKVSAASWFRKTLFEKAYNQKLKKFKEGNSTVLLDAIIFKKIKHAVLGENVRIIISGGALLNKDVQEFSQVCLSHVGQAYGLTETTANATSQLFSHRDVNTIGSVVPSSEIKLVDWEEGGYRTTDTPNPRGEIIVGGECITMGYFNMPEKTKEDYSCVNGVRYFATGDIGEMMPNGELKIIDRKKDLIKLSGGEYVSLNKIESLLKLMPMVDNACVVADPSKSNCVALICPNLKQLKSFIRDEMPNQVVENENPDKLLAELCEILEQNGNLETKLSKEIIKHVSSQGVSTFEIPTKYKFVKEIWLPDTGLVTDSLKLKRKEIEKFYSASIQLIYN